MSRHPNALEDPARLRRPRDWAASVLAVLLLNGSLTFENIWPTPAITWRGGLSIELAVAIGLLTAATLRWGTLSRGGVRLIAILWVPLVLGRYAAVTAPAIYGREISLYWDVRHVASVLGLLVTAAPVWLTIVTAAAIVLLPIAVYLPVKWAFGRLARSVADPGWRPALLALSAAIIALFVFQHVRPGGLPLTVTPPVSAIYAQQLTLLTRQMAGSTRRALGPSPALASDLKHVQGTDVLLIFIESYGAASYDRPEYAKGLTAIRRQLEADIRDTGRFVASAFVESPTFGGNSWLAHISFLTGLEVRDEDTNVVLMTERRDTLLTRFEQHGYRTVAAMPALQNPWPEGTFYGFDQIYQWSQLAYRGPEFGWWSIPDQYTLARIDAWELGEGSRQPVFLFFPTISTHTPFSPVPPYQPDWARVLTDMPYDTAVVDRVWEDLPDWMNLGPSYVRALEYDFRSIAGYLRHRAGREMVMILIGDHQPPAAVSGEGAPWDVPVHIITSRPQLIDRLVQRGFRAGLTPTRPVLAKMHRLTPMLLEVFGGDTSD